jgi:hypothetical protein
MARTGGAAGPGGRPAWAAALALLLAPVSSPLLALSFSLPYGDDSIEGVLNTTITFGAQWRMQDRASDLVGKSNLNPNLCGREDGAPRYQSCQGLFRDQVFPAQRLVSGPGQFSVNADDGNLNYDKYDITQAPLKVTQDLNLTFGDYGFFGKILYFYDFVNNDFTEYQPNMITRDNYLQVGNATFDAPPRSDSWECPPGRDNDGNPLTPCNIVYGPGGVVRRQRDDGETLRQIGTDLQMLDGYFYGRMPLWGEKDLTFKIGRQTVNWGESTFLVFGAINQANPINVNNFNRVGFAVEEVFTPLGMVFLSTEPFENATIEGFYQYEWKPLEAPAYGSYWSFVDLGSNNGGLMSANIGFGGEATDRDGLGALLDNPLSGITNTALRATRLPDREPESGGQIGLSLKYYAEWLNNGSELGLYFMNYHSRAPFVSMYATGESCAKGTISGPTFAAKCNDSPVFHGLVEPGDPFGATDSSVRFDDLRIQFEYPEDIQMFGFSFNTTVGDLSLQGEIAYRPKEPMQVAVVDLAFAAFGPTLSNCHRRNATLVNQGGELVQTGPATTCIGTNAGVGLDENGGQTVYGDSDYLAGPGTPGDFTDTYDLAIGGMSGSGRSFPSFIVPYRGGIVGLNTPCEPEFNHGTTTRNPEFIPYTPDNPCYIRGWEYMQSFQFNFGGTYVAGATDRLSQMFNADQIIALFEFGATWVPDLPPLDILQFEAPGIFLHASAGADGSGADRSRQACSYEPGTLQPQESCSFGGDGARFNPHQADLEMFPDKLSWGYDIISLIRYESVLPGISFQPQILWKHDVSGTSPGLASNFVQSRKVADIGVDMRYKSAVSFNVGYTWITGGGSANYWRDRDAARAFIKLQF